MPTNSVAQRQLEKSGKQRI